MFSVHIILVYRMFSMISISMNNQDDVEKTMTMMKMIYVQWWIVYQIREINDVN